MLVSSVIVADTATPVTPVKATVPLTAAATPAARSSTAPLPPVKPSVTPPATRLALTPLAPATSSPPVLRKPKFPVKFAYPASVRVALPVID